MVKSDITSHPTYPHIQLLLALDLAIERIRVRVIEGGHGIPVHAITRRYYTGLKNLCYQFILKYIGIVD